MSIHVLPLELLHAVSAYLDSSSLTALALVSPKLRAAAQSQLFRHLDLSPASHSLSAVLTLAKRPSLAIHVRSFALSVPAAHPVLGAFARAIACALASMTALSELHLILDPATTWILDLIPPAVSYPSLHTLSASFALDASVARFLTRAPALTSLSLATTAPSVAPAALTSITVPRLAHFAGALDAAETLAPGRPLESLHILDGDLTPSRLESMASTLSASLAVLSATTRGPLVPFLHALSQHAPMLAYLRLAAPLPIGNEDSFPDMSFYEDVACALDALPALVDFELAGMHWPSHLEADDPHSPSTPKRVWQSAPSTPRAASPPPSFAADEPAPTMLAVGTGEDLYSDLDVLF